MDDNPCSTSVEPDLPPPLVVAVIAGPSGAGKRSTIALLEDVEQFVSFTKTDPSHIVRAVDYFAQMPLTNHSRLALHLETRQPDHASSFAVYSRSFRADVLSALKQLKNKRNPTATKLIVVFHFCRQSDLAERQLYGYHPLQLFCGSLAAAIFKECEMYLQLFGDLLAAGFQDDIIFSDASGDRQARFHLLLEELRLHLDPPSQPPSIRGGSSLVTHGWNHMRTTLQQIAKAQRAFQVPITPRPTLDAPQSPAINCLVLGETGTGKELAAELIAGGRQRLHTVDCSTIVPSLVESELFGHVKGAFTDARGEKVGLVAAAKGQTLFIDEIGLVDRPIQAKLLRFVEERQYRRVGGTDYHPLDCRIIAATSRNIDANLPDAEFLQDLYHRLSGITVTLPPLRARYEDIPLLIETIKRTLLVNSAAKVNKEVSPEAMAMLMDYDWPGNIRELKKTIERLCILDPEKALIEVGDLPGKITLKHQGWREWEEYCHETRAHLRGQVSRLPPARELPEQAATSPRELLKQAKALETLALQSVYEKHHGNVSAAAKEIGVSPPTLRRRALKRGVKIGNAKPRGRTASA